MADLPQSLAGVVTPFKGDGRRLNYPTANLDIVTDLADGVYFGLADLDVYREHPAVIFIGTPTTLGQATRRVEAHLLDIPDRDYYGQPMSLSIRYFHRANQTFDDVDSLLQQMQADETAARTWFVKNPTAGQ